MASAKGIKKRRKVTQNIHKITKTMGLIATTRLRLASQKLNGFQSYEAKAHEILAQLLQGCQRHPMLEQRPDSKTIVLFAITSNRGLCGNYNMRMLDGIDRFGKEMTAQGKTVVTHLVGRKGIQHFKFHNIELAQTYPQLSDQPAWDEIAPIAQSLIQLFESKETAQVWLLYTRKFKVMREQLFPIANVSGQSVVPAGSGHQPPQAAVAANDQESWRYCYWPDTDQIVNRLLPLFVKAKLWEIFLHAAVSEQTARMLAMKTATENAEEMIKQLTRQYNRARQAQITQEILEILSGAQIDKK